MQCCVVVMKGNVCPITSGGCFLKSNLFAQTTSKMTCTTCCVFMQLVVQFKSVTIDGVTYTASLTYRVTQGATSARNFALVDRGANGGFAGANMLQMAVSDSQKVDVHGIKDTKCTALPVGTGAAKITTTSGPIIGLFHQYAWYGKGATIHSPVQMEAFGQEVCEKARSKGGKCMITTVEGYHIPLSIQDGLAYMKMTRPTDADMKKYKHVTMTSDTVWDPTTLDEDWDEDDMEDEPPELEFYHDDDDPDEDDDDDEYAEDFTNHDLNVYMCINGAKEESEEDATTPFQVHNQSTTEKDDGESTPPQPEPPDEKVTPPKPSKPTLGGTVIPLRTVLPKKPDYEALRPYFVWLPIERIKATIKGTAQWFKAEGRIPMRCHYKTRFPAANVSRLNEDVATDTFFSETPALDDGIPGHGGCTMVQIFTGIKSHITEAIPMDAKSDFPESLKEFIRKWGAPNGLMSDNAWEQTSKTVIDILRHYNIGHHHKSEPKQHNQNTSERRIQDIKRSTDTAMDRTNTPAFLWLLCLLYIAGLFNHVAHACLQDMTPITKATGQQVDVSKYLAFHWLEPVYYHQPHEASFPSTSSERPGWYVGPADDIGDNYCYCLSDNLWCT